MSRLDDELKIAFRRQEPSPDFAARVLARLDEAPAAPARPGLWQRLSGMFAMPAWRFAAVTAVAVLLVLVGIALLRSRPTASGEKESSALAAAPEKANNGTAKAPEKTPVNKDGLSVPDHSTQAVATPANASANNPPPPRAVKSYHQIHHHAPVIAQQAPPSAEAEAAKEKVMFALQITSEALNDAQRAISDDHTRDENPEPVHNR